MKKKIVYSGLLFIALFSVILFLHKNDITYSSKKVILINKPNFTISKSETLPSKLDDAFHGKAIFQNTRTPSPLNQLSTDEKARFPQGVVIDTKIQSIEGSDDKLQIRVIKTDTHLGYVRVEEFIDSSTNHLLKRIEMRSNTILLGLLPGINPDFMLGKNRLVFKSFKQIIPDDNVYEFTLNSHDVTALPKALEYTKDFLGTLVEYMEPNYIAVSTKEPNDPEYPKLWGLSQISAPRAWDTRSETTPYPVIVAVVDTGIDFTHEDLRDNMWKNPTELPSNGIDDDKNGYIDDVHGANLIAGIGAPGSGNVMDIDGHGTHVAGTIGAVGNNAIGITGVAWRLQKIQLPQKFGGLMAVKCLTTSGGTFADISAAIDYAVKRKSDILNLSLGGASESITLKNAVRRAQGNGVILVCSAGNDDLDIDLDINKRYPVCYDFDNIVAVGASDQGDSKCSFSNFGRINVDIFAPGEDIYSTIPPSPSKYGLMSGTSMAAPHVSGCLALLKAQYPSEGYKGWISRLFGKADKIPSLVNLCAKGARINLYQSINNITARPTPPPRDIPDLRTPPATRGVTSRDNPALRAPASPNPRPTPRTRLTPLPRSTPRPRI